MKKVSWAAQGLVCRKRRSGGRSSMKKKGEGGGREKSIGNMGGHWVLSIDTTGFG